MKLLYEDDNVLAIDKPAGVSVHPGHGHAGEPTIVDMLEKQIKQPVYLVHRLDRDTSGVLLLAKTDDAKKRLQKQFKRRTVQKTYLALVRGHLEHKQATIDVPIARNPKNPLKRAVRGRGKPSITEYSVQKRYQDYDLLEVRPKTGRTHQIRVHLFHIGHPVVGDKLYGTDQPGLSRQFLHAKSLSFLTPDGQRMVVKSSLPADLKLFLKSL